ncbi:hypothetical protein BH23VER1_BH23VER1_32310 [soil metagenome]
MARSIRIEFAGAYYHGMARGNRCEAIFVDDDDRRFFLAALAEACGMTGWRVHAWVLMGNHYHLFIQTPEPNLVAGMSWLQNTYTRRFNVRHALWGRLFGDRYKAVLVEGDDGHHYRGVADYIHLNPVRAGIAGVLEGQSVADYPWSSIAGGYALPPGKRARWLAAAEGLSVFQLNDTAAGRRKMVARLDGRAAEEAGEECGVPEEAPDADARRSNFRRGWFWGGKKFEKKVRKLAEKAAKSPPKRSRAYRRIAAAVSHGEDAAEHLLAEGLAAAGLSRADLDGLYGSDPRKVALAKLLWKQTTVSQGWIAERLAMRSAANVGQQLRRLEGRETKDPLPPRLRAFVKRNTTVAP